MPPEEVTGLVFGKWDCFGDNIRHAWRLKSAGRSVRDFDVLEALSLVCREGGPAEDYESVYRWALEISADAPLCPECMDKIGGTNAA